jgi:hypothetical protein
MMNDVLSRFAASCWGALALALLLGGVAAPAPACAQATTGGDGSIYSRFGAGERRTYSSPQAQAMGGGGLALRSLNYTGVANPALWSDQEFTRLAIEARYRQVSAQNETGQTSQLSNGALQAVQFSFPLYAGKLGVGVGFRPYSRLEYRVQDDPQPVSPVADSATYRVRFEGEGGLQEISGGLGYRFGEMLAVGARAGVVFGILENQRATTFSTPRFSPTTISTRTRASGFTGTAGALLSLGDVLRDGDALSAGATLTLPATLTGERTLTSGRGLEPDTLNIGSGAALEDEGSLRLPVEAALGLSYKPSNRWTVVADGRYEAWGSGSESTFETSLPGFEGLRDRFRASAGVEFLPAGTNRNTTFFRRTAYRLGGYYEQSYVGPRALPDETTDGVNVLGATAGLSLPTPLYGTRIDVGFEAGTRGATSGAPVRDLFYGVSLGVNLGERWFQRRKLR